MADNNWYHVTKKDFNSLDPSKCELGVHTARDKELAKVISFQELGCFKNKDCFLWTIELSDDLDDTIFLDDQPDWSDVEELKENLSNNLSSSKNKSHRNVLMSLAESAQSATEIKNALLEHGVTQIEYENTEEVSDSEDTKCRIILHESAIVDCSRKRIRELPIDF